MARIEDIEHVWEAFAVEGKPLCLGSRSTKKHPEGIEVAVYVSKKGRIKGVTVWDGDTEQLLAAVGELPAPARAAIAEHGIAQA